MHTRTGINYKLSLPSDSLEKGRNHFASEKNVALSFSVSLKNYWQDPKPCFGDIALVFQSLRGTDPQILLRGDFADAEV